MQESNILIEVENLSKEYALNGEKFVALDDVSFVLRKNESIGLIGKNGSGKSTLLKILAGLVKPSKGEIKIYGKINSLIEVGSNFIPDLTGRENVKQFLTLNDIPKNEIPEIIEKVLEYSELGQFFDQPIKLYSSGMFVRLAISSGFQVKADIFLLDEVLMAGDAAFKEKVALSFNEIIGKGTSLIIASHNPEEIMHYTSECFWLEKGILKERKPSSVALQDYYLEYAKELSEKKKKANAVVLEINQGSTSKLKSSGEDQAILSISNHSQLNYETRIDFNISYRNTHEFQHAFPVIKIFSILFKPLLSVIATQEIRKELDKQPLNTSVNLSAQLPAKILRNGKYYAELSFVEQPVEGNDFVREVYTLEQRLEFELKSLQGMEVSNSSFEIYILPEGKWALKK